MKKKERVEILFEKIQDDVKLVLEGYSILENKIEGVANEVKELKADLKRTREGLLERIEKGEAVLRNEIQEVRAELKQEIQEVRAELKQEIQEVKDKIDIIDKKLDNHEIRISALEKNPA